MKGIFFIVCLVLISVIGVYSATIFDGRRARHLRMDSKIKALNLRSSANNHVNTVGDYNANKRHISTLKLPDPIAVEKVRREMKKRISKNEDKSNERNIWRSHPQMKEYQGPDTTEAVGLDI